MRLIDGDALIAWIKESQHMTSKMRNIICKVETMPSADRPQEWITCRERMPKKEEATYLICTETGHMCSCRWTNNMYGLGSNEWSKWGWHIMDKPQYAKVVAWMPLKPWKGADDE